MRAITLLVLLGASSVEGLKMLKECASGCGANECCGTYYDGEVCTDAGCGMTAAATGNFVNYKACGPLDLPVDDTFVHKKAGGKIYEYDPYGFECDPPGAAPTPAPAPVTPAPVAVVTPVIPAPLVTKAPVTVVPPIGTTPTAVVPTVTTKKGTEEPLNKYA